MHTHAELHAEFPLHPITAVENGEESVMTEGLVSIHLGERREQRRGTVMKQNSGTPEQTHRDVALHVGASDDVRTCHLRGLRRARLLRSPMGVDLHNQNWSVRASALTQVVRPVRKGDLARTQAWVARHDPPPPMEAEKTEQLQRRRG